MARKLADRDIIQLLAALEDGNISDDGLEDENEDEEAFLLMQEKLFESWGTRMQRAMKILPIVIHHWFKICLAHQVKLLFHYT